MLYIFTFMLNSHQKIFFTEIVYQNYVTKILIPRNWFFFFQPEGKWYKCDLAIYSIPRCSERCSINVTYFRNKHHRRTIKQRCSQISQRLNLRIFISDAATFLASDWSSADIVNANLKYDNFSKPRPNTTDSRISMENWCFILYAKT